MAAKNTDIALRERLLSWLRHYLDQFAVSDGTRDAFARRLGISGPALSQYLNRRRTIGLDMLALMHSRLHVSADVMLDSDPPAAVVPADASRTPPETTRQPRSTKGSLQSTANRG